MTGQARLSGPAQVDAAWLKAMLADAGHKVDIRDVDATGIGTGQLGETARFVIGYEPGGMRGPATIVGKFASTDPTSLEVAAAWSLYEREVRFYHKLAPQARIATPACSGAPLDETGAFVLLLEDLAPAAPGDQFKGLSGQNAIRAVQQAARLHAAFWGQGEHAEFAWLETGPLAQPSYPTDIFRSAWSGFCDRFRDRLSDGRHRVCEALADG